MVAVSSQVSDGVGNCDIKRWFVGKTNCLWDSFAYLPWIFFDIFLIQYHKLMIIIFEFCITIIPFGMDQNAYERALEYRGKDLRWCYETYQRLQESIILILWVQRNFGFYVWFQLGLLHTWISRTYVILLIIPFDLAQ